MTNATKTLKLRLGMCSGENHYIAGTIVETGASTGAFSLGDVTVDPKQFIRRLGVMGLVIKRSDFCEAVKEAASTPPSFDVVTSPGWHRHRDYAYGALVITPTGEDNLPNVELAVADYDERTLAKFRTAGTLTDWQKNLGKYLEGNSRGVFACGLAFAGPLLDLVDVPQCGGFQYVGESGGGKTSLEISAASSTGHKAGSVKGAVEEWLNTATWIETVGLCHADICLFLDETHQATSKSFKDGIFRLSQSEEKGRATNTRSTRTYRLVFLSSSNKTVAEIMTSTDEQVDEAFLSRVLDIPYPKGSDDVFDTWHDFTSGAELADHLKAAANRYYGTPMVRYLNCLVADRKDDETELREKIARRVRIFRKRVVAACPNNVSRYGRAIDRGGLAYAGIALAIEYNVLNWDKVDALEGIVSCLVDGLALAAKTTGARRKDPKTGVIEFLRKSRKRLHDLDNGYPDFTAKQIGDVPGYCKQSSSGTKWVYLTLATLESLVPLAKDRKVLMRDLVACGMSEPPREGQTVQRKLFDRGRNQVQRVYSFAFGLTTEGRED